MDDPARRPLGAGASGPGTIAGHVLDAFARLGAATAHEAAGRTGAADPGIRPLIAGSTLVGPAFTIHCHPGDNLALHRALAVAPPGCVLVATAGGHLAGYWGEIMTVGAQQRGISGLVIDGGVRDVAALRRHGFLTWARGISVIGCQKLTPGVIDRPVVCGGVFVGPGDLVVADDDGVVFVPAERIEQVLRAALQRAEGEREYVRRLEAGQTTLEALGIGLPGEGTRTGDTRPG